MPEKAACLEGKHQKGGPPTALGCGPKRAESKAKAPESWDWDLRAEGEARRFSLRFRVVFFSLQARES